MCGRYATTRSSVDLATLFEAVDGTEGAVVPDYNVAPTDPVPVVTATGDGRELRVARWGLVPPWARDPRIGARMINARAETVMRANAFAPSFRSRRCLVPADGWYEWQAREGGGKQPYFLNAPGGLTLAGVWTVSATGMMTFAIVTTAAIGHLQFVHDRMPLILPPDRWNGWLSGPADPDTLLAVPSAKFLESVEVRPVGPAVGDVRNDGPELVRRIVVTALPTNDVQPTDLTLF